MSEIEAIDRRGLIREAYAIEGIGPAECRSIFLDWALFDDDHPLPQAQRIGMLLAHYGDDRPDHPMSQVLREGLEGAASAKGRRGGRRGRRNDDPGHA